jgi:hypothetical protein
VIERRDQRLAALVGEPAADRLAILGDAVVDHDLGAIAARRRQLDRRRIVRHHDRRGHAEQLRRERDRLGVVSGRERHHAGAALCVSEPRQRVEGAAKLERAAALEALALEHDLGAEQRVGHPRAQHRRAVGVAVEPRRSRDDVVVGRERQLPGPLGAAGRGVDIMSSAPLRSASDCIFERQTSRGIVLPVERSS